MIKQALAALAPDKLIRKATMKDLNEIMDIVWRTVMLLQSEGNKQWSEEYPTRSDFIHDISEGSLYVCEVDKAVAGFICCNQTPPPEYTTVKWSAADFPALFLHRFAVSTDLHRQGIGTALLKKADELAAEQGCHSLRTDTCSVNVRMRALFSANGYRKTGEVHFPDVSQTFFCYEKLLVK